MSKLNLEEQQLIRRQKVEAQRAQLIEEAKKALHESAQLNEASDTAAKEVDKRRKEKK